MSIDFDVKDETVRSVLELVHPKLEHTVGLDRKLELIDALKVRQFLPASMRRVGT